MRKLLAVCLLIAGFFGAGCATKQFVTTSGLVLVFPEGQTNTDGQELFVTSSSALPGYSTGGATYLVWKGVSISTNEANYPMADFLLYARQDHFHRMHDSLMVHGKRIRELLAQNPVEFEPIWDVRPSTNNQPSEVKSKPFGLPQNDLWPVFPERPFWYQDDDFTQIKTARSNVMARMTANPMSVVRVGHIDTGTRSTHLGHPANIVHPASFTHDKGSLFDAPLDNAEDKPEDSNALLHAYGHGLATLSVLASPALLNHDGVYDAGGELQGVVPFAEVVPVRARPSFMHFFPVRLARAIMHCVTNQVDVISVSQGGTPSLALTAVINEAYERGTLIVAASSDFIYPYIIPSAIPFRDMAYPARYNRVLAAAGLDGNYQSYGNNRWHAFPAYWIRFWKLGPNVLPLTMRGSYGPEESMGNTLCGFAPNIPFADSDNDSRFDLDGGGTSATTPQVAGAAALWLQYYMSDFDAKYDRWSWEKVEMMTLALKKTASLRHIRETQYVEKFGHGYIKAADALNESPDSLHLSLEKKPAEIYPYYENLNLLYTWIYLNSLKGVERKIIGTAFGEDLKDYMMLSRYVGSYMRQAMVLREMLIPSSVQAHSKLDRELAEFLTVRVDVEDKKIDREYNQELDNLSKRLAFAFNSTAGRMGAWKRERQWHDWFSKEFRCKVMPSDVQKAIRSITNMHDDAEKQLQQYFYLGEGI